MEPASVYEKKEAVPFIKGSASETKGNCAIEERRNVRHNCKAAEWTIGRRVGEKHVRTMSLTVDGHHHGPWDTSQQ